MNMQNQDSSNDSDIRLEEIARNMVDCRLCKNYSFSRSCEVEYFDCLKGYFSFVDYAGGHENEGKMNWFGCRGRDFSFIKSSLWESLYDEYKKEIEEKKSVRRGFEKVFIPRFFNQACRSIMENAFEDLTTWLIDPSPIGEIMTADSIAAFSFGFGPEKKEGRENRYDPIYFHPGKSNDALADLIKMLKEENPQINLENIFVQWEIAESLNQRYGISVNQKHIAKPQENYLGTGGVADFFFKNGLGEYSKVAVFAHPFHMYRCVKTLAKSAKDHGYNPRILIMNTNEVPFDERSFQSWTRNIQLWILHELSSRAYAREKGICKK